MGLASEVLCHFCQLLQFVETRASCEHFVCQSHTVFNGVGHTGNIKCCTRIECHQAGSTLCTLTPVAATCQRGTQQLQ